MATALSEPGGFVSERLIDYHTARAKGGCWLNIVELSAVHSSSIGNGKFGLGLYGDKFIPGLKKLASAIKNAGSQPAIRIWRGHNSSYRHGDKRSTRYSRFFKVKGY